jgi:serine/threonine-protein kinase
MPAFSSTDERLSTALNGQYEIEREIGRGGMGVVYLARDLRLDRVVAIKTLPTDKAEDPAIRDRFLREARMAAKLAHPNIVPIHHSDEVDGNVFFVMGFVDGDSVASRLAARGPFSPRDAVPILRDVAAALGYAHQRGVVHRDVKTENILLDTLTGRAMVTDFGIAFATEAAPLTATGQILGTVYYLSPEQVSGDKVDPRSDIYALGVVGYAMLSGKFPFDGPLASAVLVSHVTKQALPLSVAAPNVPASLSMIIDRCLAKDPTHRFQSCADLDTALAAAQADASRITTAAARSVTPLISKTEANQILGRAAELSETGLQDRPASLMKRDAAADARRKEGFKTQNLREAAIEAGIAPKSVERALQEHGLRPAPDEQLPVKGDRRPVNLTFDMSQPPKALKGQPSELIYEMVVQGEVSADDYDVLLSAITHFTTKDGLTGRATSIGRTLTWQGQSESRRQVHVDVIPRGGRTTLRVMEMLKRPIKTIYTIIGGVGGVMFGGSALAYCVEYGHVAAGLVLGGGIVSLALLVARTASDDYSQKRQKEARNLLEGLGAQARGLNKTD